MLPGKVSPCFFVSLLTFVTRETQDFWRLCFGHIVTMALFELNSRAWSFVLLLRRLFKGEDFKHDCLKCFNGQLPDC